VDFGALQQRLRQSAPARAAKLAGEVPAALIGFDVLHHSGRDLRPAPYDKRRGVLEDILREAPRGVGLMPMTTNPDAAGAWLGEQPPGIEGVVAKRRDQRYRPGARSWQKVRARSTTRPSSAACSAASSTPKLWSSVTTEPTGSGWSDVRDRCPSPRAPNCGVCCGRRGASIPGRFGCPPAGSGQTPGGEVEYTQVAPELVVEVETDTAFEHGRWRHATRYLRLSADLAPEDVAADSA
jgi:hypothetical protein